MDLLPKLRALDFQPVVFKGQQMWYLRDPLRLSEIQLFVPYSMTPLFTLINGTRTIKELHMTFCQLTGADVPASIVYDAVDQLDKACLLLNDRAQAAQETQLAAYRAKPYRLPAIAGQGYPSQSFELAEMLDRFNAGDRIAKWSSWRGRGIISPHIDYQRGGSVYAQVWKRAAAAIEAAELVLIFGTDHCGGPGSITLTRQAYATPYGPLPTDLELIDKLASAIGDDAAFSDELHHRDEHSIELSAVWLHHIIQSNGLAQKAMVPILVGSFQHFLINGTHPGDDDRLNTFLEVLRQETTGRKVLAVASVDLAHMGPAFGDNARVDSRQRADIQAFDQALISSAIEGNAAKWYTLISANQDRNRICGFAPTYLLLRYLGASDGYQIAYDQCPADPDNASLVSICGLLID